MLKEFKEFAVRGNVVDMAVGIIIGASFGSIVKSLVDDIIMPPIGLLLGNVDFTNLYVVLKAGAGDGVYTSLAEAKKAGAVTLNYGVFINSVVSFLIVAFAVFLLVRTINRLREQVETTAEAAPENTKECPRCRSTIHKDATRCPNCTSELG
ncbi:large conductance mechanosensitive channel [Novimethylophilus kurashikiensis]|uniref:Large-conductance mechanosensitive channel n=1 Tax=Novimethylophilus kurashikiensis TaxID=1825523 RepID=A0A2R5FDH0_9PROT|nr:large conductance mechanosensitive channel protein MscL [Novimethylophilus kurashikiensis]GBG15548.1 large conductance mechanosensitive channel [Novimethylophilus kurashikiensis]